MIADYSPNARVVIATERGGEQVVAIQSLIPHKFIRLST
jgi:hypothetical protein